MNPQKIIKIYFVFLLLISGFYGSAKIDSVKDFYINGGNKLVSVASDLHSIGNMRLNMANVAGYDYKKPKEIVEKDYLSKDKVSDFVIMEFNRQSGTGFARKGDFGVNIMDISFRSFEKDFEIRKISLSLEGAEITDLEEIYLMNEKGDKYFASKVGDKMIFDNIFEKVLLGENKILKAYSNLGEGLESNNRFRFYISDPSDLNVLIEGQDYSVKTNYPVNGPWFSVVGEKVSRDKVLEK